MRHLKLTLFLLAFIAGSAFTSTPLPNVEAHWLANTGGKKDDHVQNFITDMIVNYNPDRQYPRPMVLTASAWDEGGNAFGAYFNGASLGKAEWWQNIIYSDTAYSNSQKCWIVNYWARASYYRRTFVGHEGPPPSGDMAPYVKCKDGSVIKSVTDPSALAFDMVGNLLVADNGPDHNIKIFSAQKKLLRTFGDSGGVFAQSKTTAEIIPGTAGTRRFWGIYGLGVDSQGNVYVGTSGIPQQVMGGTDIRVFSGKDSSLIWQVQGLSFVNNGDADPGTDGKIISLNAKRFEMDYSKKPGASWKLKSVTLDPFKYPFDPRINSAWESVWSRTVQGTRYLYLGNMYGGGIAIIRFAPGSEIGIPTAVFGTYQDMAWWAPDSQPTWDRNEANKRNRWYWVDRNGDGTPQKSEFTVYENWNLYSQGLDVDDSGNIWASGTAPFSAYFRSGGVTKFEFGKATNGIPVFDKAAIKRYTQPKEIKNGSIRLKYLASGDIMYLATGANAWMLDTIYRYDNFTDTVKRKLVSATNLGFDAAGQTEIRLDQGSDKMTLPFSFTADSDYIYVGNLDNGRYSGKRGEVTVYNSRTGEPVGFTGPDSGLGNFAGALDIVNAINVTTQKSGHKIIMVEEDGTGKVISYRWLPSGVVDTVKEDTVVVVKQPLDAPGNFTGIAGDKSATLSWSGVAGALKYRVYRVVTTTRDSLIADITDTSVTVTGLRNGTTYKFKILASNTDTVSPASVVVSVKPAVPAPGQVTVLGSSTLKITLTWGSVPYATKYNVMQTKDGVTTKLVGTSKLTYIVTLVSGSSYVFEVVAANSSKIGTGSNKITVVAP